MSINGKDRGTRGFTYKDLTDDSGAEGSDGDGVALVMSDSDSPRRGGASRKYVVSEDDDGNFSSICKPQKFTRNERICVIVGGLILLAAIILLIVAILVTQLPGGSGQPGSGGSGQTGSMPWENVRLPGSVTPTHYDVNLNVNLETFQVTGSVNVTCTVNNKTKYVLIHAKDMSIGQSTVQAQSKVGGDLTAVQATGTFQPKHEFYVLELGSSLQPGTVYVYLAFNYTLRDDLAGFYKSSYVSESGERKYLATTQFEPTDARRAFPCFDEPSLKANFTMHITHDPKYHAVSNMPAVNRSPNPDGTVVTTNFETSLQMSTYLVAFIVSDFKCMNDTIVEGHEDRPLKIQVCSSPVVSNKTEYALQKAKDILMFYEKEFNVPYPLPKQDLFAIPDFSAGAMENWGLITYRETALLYDDETDPATSKQRVAVVIAHELAHQWFGNLVTMAWWDGLWLNEGFASFMEYIGTNSSEPDFDMMDQFFGSDLSGALDLDSLNESHPILQEVASPDEINSLFDTISYSKGASVIRMLKHHLGKDNFKAGITDYLNSHKYGNAMTSELWDTLQKQVPRHNPTVSALMDTWTKQEGYPVVDMSVSGSTLTLSQRRFLAVPPDGYNPNSDDGFLWKIPFDYITCDQPNAQSNNAIIMETKTKSVARVTSSPNCWIKANVNQSGFYRVNYDTGNWYLLINHLKRNLQSTVLSPVDRAGLLDDVFSFARAGLLKTSTALNMTEYLDLSRETAYPPWEVAIKWFYTLGDLLSLTSLYGKYREFVSNLLKPMVTRVMNFEETNISHFDVYLRSVVLRAAWKFGNEEVIANATEMFKQWMKNNIPIDPNLKTLVYGVGVAVGGEEAWNFVWEKYNTTNDPYEKRLLLRSLAESTEPWILSRYLNYSITRIRSQDTLSVIVYISRNIYGRYLAWNFVRNNWPYIREEFGGSSFFDRFIRYITESFSTQFELDELVDFFARNPDAGSATRGYRQAIEAIKGNIQWLANSRDLQTCLDDTQVCFNP